MYVEKTKHSRDSVSSLSSYQRPNGAITAETIPRCIKTVLATSGIDTSVFVCAQHENSFDLISDRLGVSN